MSDNQIQNPFVMWEKIWNAALNQGFSILLLLAFAYWANQRMNRLEVKADDCQREKLEILRAQNSELKTVIEANTRAMTELTSKITSKK